MSKKLKVTINGHLWKVHIVDDKAYKAERGCLDSQAVTVYHHPTKQRAIWIRQKYLNFDTVLHEVLHAYLSYKDMSKQSYGQIEETFCEFLPKKIYQMIRVTKTILGS